MAWSSVETRIQMPTGLPFAIGMSLRRTVCRMPQASVTHGPVKTEPFGTVYRSTARAESSMGVAAGDHNPAFAARLRRLHKKRVRRFASALAASAARAGAVIGCGGIDVVPVAVGEHEIRHAATCQARDRGDGQEDRGPAVRARWFWAIASCRSVRMPAVARASMVAA